MFFDLDDETKPSIQRVGPWIGVDDVQPDHWPHLP